MAKGGGTPVGYATCIVAAAYHGASGLARTSCLVLGEYWNRNVRLGEAVIGPQRTGAILRWQSRWRSRTRHWGFHRRRVSRVAVEPYLRKPPIRRRSPLHTERALDRVAP